MLPCHEAALKLLGLQRSENISEMIVRWCAVLERSKPAQQVDLLLTKPGDAGEALGPYQHGRQAQEQNLIERIGRLAELAQVLQIIEITQKNDASSSATQSVVTLSIANSRQANRGLA